MARPGTALSPEWDRGFDEAFTDLITSDADLVRAEFDALIAACWPSPPAPPATSGDQRHRGSAEPPDPPNTH